MSKRENKEKGNAGENIAEQYLRKHGYRILARNFKTGTGEIDIIATDDACLIFVEVKMRFGDEYGLPSEAVDYAKQRKLAAVAAQYIKRYMLFGAPARFDVIEVRGDTKEVNHIINAFETHMRY